MSSSRANRPTDSLFGRVRSRDRTTSTCCPDQRFLNPLRSQRLGSDTRCHRARRLTLHRRHRLWPTIAADQGARVQPRLTVVRRFDAIRRHPCRAAHPANPRSNPSDSPGPFGLLVGTELCGQSCILSLQTLTLSRCREKLPSSPLPPERSVRCVTIREPARVDVAPTAPNTLRRPAITPNAYALATASLSGASSNKDAELWYPVLWSAPVDLRRPTSHALNRCRQPGDTVGGDGACSEADDADAFGVVGAAVL